MVIRPIVPLTPTSKVLRSRAPSVKAPGQIESVMVDLVDTWPTQRALGIAAPQIGVRQRLFIFRSHDAEDAPPEILINPKIIRAQGTLEDYEGCLSIAHLYGRCAREAVIEVTALDVHFERVRRRFEGYDARIIQHELDHLDGVLYIDRLEDWYTLHQVRQEAGESDPETTEWEAVPPPASVISTLQQLARPLPGYALRW